MANKTQFEVQRGSVICDCMPETYEFINQNMAFFYSNLSSAVDKLSDDGDVAFISLEDKWSFACNIKKSELGRVASATGVISEGTSCIYDEILQDII